MAVLELVRLVEESTGGNDVNYWLAAIVALVSAVVGSLASPWFSDRLEMRRARKNDIYTAKIRLAEVRALQVIPHQLHHFGVDVALMKEIADNGVRRWYPEYLGATTALKTALVSIERDDQVFTEAINFQDWRLPDELLKRVSDALYKIEK